MTAEGIGKIQKQVRNQVRYEMEDRIGTVEDRLWTQVEGQIGSSVLDLVLDGIWDRLSDQMSSHLIAAQIKNRH